MTRYTEPKFTVGPNSAGAARRYRDNWERIFRRCSFCGGRFEDEEEPVEHSGRIYHGQCAVSRDQMQRTLNHLR